MRRDEPIRHSPFGTRPSMTAIFLSPHLDDVAFSCGGLAARLAAAGARTVLATPLTASVDEPTGFALACQTDKGLAPEVDYMALRRAEDHDAAEALGASAVVHGELPEAPHRGYDSADALFDGLRDGDSLGAPLRMHVAGLVAAEAPGLVLAPLGLGSHVDHVHVVRAVEALMVEARAGGAEGPPVAWYRDTPYALRAPDAAPASGRLATLPARVVPLDAQALGRKLDAAAAYASQLGFQFGGEAAMRRALTDFAEAEGARHGLRGPAEVVRADDRAWDALQSALAA